MPLILAPEGKPMTVLKILTDGETRRHLENLGILRGALVTALKCSGGDIILKVKESRLALNKLIAMKIFVA